ncbi:GPI inositol deacylase [Boothiomyces sp. JEL0866]|nr:GPI inositol deacylase [Boothiomyces sp. JEL0866]
MGSVAYRLWLQRNKTDLPLDLYAMETREELGAFHSNLLHDQAFYANEAVEYILQSYPENERPESVVILGHSMGGIVARYIPTLESYNVGKIKDIFTLSSPHREAPIPISRSMVNLYRNLNNYWKSEHREGRLLENITFVSVAGGSRDTILDSDTTFIHHFADPTRSFHGFSTGIPGIWTSADHEGAVWCDQILQKIVLGVFEVSKNSSATVIDRMKHLNELYVGREIPTTTPQFGSAKVPWRHLRVLLTENYVELPALTTSEYEDRYIRITLPPIGARHLYELHLLSSVEDLNLLGCAKDSLDSEFQCKSMNYFLKPLPIPDNGDFKIVFRDPTNMDEKNRKHWISIDMPLANHDDLDTIIFHIPPKNSGFLYADIRFPQKRIENDFTTTGLTITTTSVKTNVKFLPIKDPIVKYQLKVQRVKGASVVTGLDYQVPTQFPMLIMQKIANESRPVSMVGNNLVFFYTDRGHELNEGLEFDIWADPQTDPYELILHVDYLGSLSSFTTFFKTIWVSLGFSSLLVALAGEKVDLPYLVFGSQLNIRLPISMLICSAVYFLFGDLTPEIFNGNRDFIFVPLYTVQYYLALGLMNGVFLLTYHLVGFISRILKARLLVVNSNGFKLGFAGVLLLAQFMISSSLLLPFILIHSFAVCANDVGRYQSKKSNIFQILCLNVQLILIGFKIPSMIQSLNYIANGISNPLGNDFLGFFIQMMFSFYLSEIPKREFQLKIIIWIMVILLFVYGWKYTYLVNELGLLFMALMMLSQRLGLSQKVNEAFLKYE